MEKENKLTNFDDVLDILETSVPEIVIKEAMYMRLGTQVNPLAEFIKYNNIVLGGMLNKLTDEINPELGIYKGVIITPSKYFENDVNEKINEILQK